MTAAAFTRILVPYDGSEPADAALAFAIAFGRAGAHVDLVHVIDQAGALSPAMASMTAFDPEPLLQGLDDQAAELLRAAAERCRAAGVEPTATLEHEVPVVGILGAAERNADDLIVLGTHGRSGLPRLFLGSVTEGVLRSGSNTTTSPKLQALQDAARARRRRFFH